MNSIFFFFFVKKVDKVKLKFIVKVLIYLLFYKMGIFLYYGISFFFHFYKILPQKIKVKSELFFNTFTYLRSSSILKFDIFIYFILRFHSLV